MAEPEDIEIAEEGQGDRRRVIGLVAAGCLIVVAVAGVAIVAFGGGDDRPRITDETPAGSGGVAALWGNRYQITSTVESSGDEPWIPPSEPPLTMTFGTDRTVSFTGCNGGTGRAADGDEELAVPEMMSTMRACIDADGEALMAHDTRTAELLRAGATIGGTADAPVLTGVGGGEVRLRLIGPAPEPPPPVDDPDAPVSSDDESTETTQAP